METHLIKRLARVRVLSLAGAIANRPNQVASLSLYREAADSVTLYAFAEGEGISREILQADSLYLILEGEARVDIDGVKSGLKAGDCVVVPAHATHSLETLAPVKLLNIVIE